MMKKLLIAILILLSCLPVLSAQGTTDPNASTIGIETAQQDLVEISVSKFEDAGMWRVIMSNDQGLVSRRRLSGAPSAKTAIAGEEAAGIKERDIYVLGVKAEFFRRGFNTIVVEAVKPIPVEGITKTVSIWVVGRNYPHVLKLLIRDYNGRVQEVTMGKMNFIGWKKMTVGIPPSIPQNNYHFTQMSGIRIVGFKIECDPVESFGTYYLYLDDLRAVADQYGEMNRDEDDMIDSW